MNRRSMMKLTGGAGLGVLVATQVSCKVKDIAFWVSTITGALSELSPLLPGSAATIAKAVTVANEFLAAYKAGKFSSAYAIFQNLVGFISQIANDVGLSGNPSLKIIFAVASVAARTIATLLVPQVPATLMASASTPEQAMVQRMTSPSAVETVFAASKF